MHVLPPAYVFDAGGGLFILLVALAGVAIGVFIAVQAWLNSPQRREFNQAWFAQFEDHMRQSYANKGLAWRTLDMASHFDHSVH
jgi:hypothetical protein